MFLDFTNPPRDPLWTLTSAFRADHRPEKLDLVLGVYRDETGITPVMAAVQEAEIHLAKAAASKTYRALSGNADFNLGMTRLLLGQDNEATERVVTMQTVGGTGALRLLGELIAAAHPGATIWLSNPGYINHRPIMRAAGLAVAEYPWQERHGRLDLAAVLSALADARTNDVLLLQGCCHNPTGIDLSPIDWEIIADVCRARNIIVLVDMAYQGLGDGLEEDAAGLRLLVSRLDTVLVASSCSKNMGLYCERTGAATVIVQKASALPSIRTVMEGIARCNYSMPPEHGAAIAATLMAEPAQWHAELQQIRTRIAGIRSALASALREAGAPQSMQAVLRQRGMFSILPLDSHAMHRLREQFAIYGTAEGRINVAGLTEDKIGHLAQALAAVSLPDAAAELAA